MPPLPPASLRSLLSTDRRLADWIFDGTGSVPGLNQLNPRAKPMAGEDKSADKQVVERLAVELDELQDIFLADARFKLLVVLQGMDTSGKDGTIRGVFGRMSPLGVHSYSFKAPTAIEASYDYLWRIHQRVPRRGEIVIFNRSHYEDVLVPQVKGWIDAEEVARRHAHIRDFERMLAETGTVILKCLLHISKDEQRERLQARLDDPEKNWKFDPADLEARKQWSTYQKAYEGVLSATSTPWAPWIVVPSDSKTHRNLMIATLVRDTLAGLGLRHPVVEFDPASIRIT